MFAHMPTTAPEAGGPVDVVLITGDAYVDDPGFGAAVIGRWLQAHGFSVGIIAQPAWDSPEPFQALGRPRLFFGITAGNLDSVVASTTALGKRRNDDACTPGGQAGARPDRASIAYTARARQAFPGVPVVLGGVEASLRRLAHWDFQQEKVRGSILLDAKADLLVFGMGERAVLGIAERLAAGAGVAGCRDLPGVAFALGAAEPLPPREHVALPSAQDCQRDPWALAQATLLAHREAEPLSARPVLQRHAERAVWCNPPALPLSSAELDAVFALPFARAPHPGGGGPVPAFESLRASLTVTRGCGGGCAFCAISLHQGRHVVSRSPASVLAEADRLAASPGWRGTITDVGGPTANLYGFACASETLRARCRRPSCLFPRRCTHLQGDPHAWLALLRAVAARPGVRHVFVGSGLRHELLLDQPGLVAELCAHHVSGRLTVAPEHSEPAVLRRMHKPGVEAFLAFKDQFERASRAAGRRLELMPYLMAGHPGAGPAEAVALARFLAHHDLRPRQIQLFVPTPGTLSTAMFCAGRDPVSGEPIPVARDPRDRARQRALLLWWKPEEAPAVREALAAWGFDALIGRGAGKLVGPGPLRGAWLPRPGERRDSGRTTRGR